MSIFGRTDDIHYTNPRKLPKWTIAASSMQCTLDSSGTARLSTTSQFWTDFIALQGVQVDSDYAANTYKTIVNITSGAGVLAAIIGPTAGGAETTTFEITKDGEAPVEIARTLASGDRAYIGYNPGNTLFTAAGVLSDARNSTISNDGFTTGGQGRIADITSMLFLGTPLLEYKISLLVRIKHSANVTGTGSQERRSGAMYYDGYDA